MRKTLTAAALALGLLNTGCALNSTAQSAAPDVAENSAPIPVSLKKGQVISYILINSKRSDEAQSVRQAYYEKAFPLASGFGLQRVIDLQEIGRAHV